MLGYVGNKGHKRWRRYKKKIVDSGSLSHFVGEHDGGYHEFLKVEQAPSTAEVNISHQQTMCSISFLCWVKGYPVSLHHSMDHRTVPLQARQEI